MSYRIFKFNSNSKTYHRVDPDINGKGLTWQGAALSWVNDYYRGGETKVDLIVSRFGPNTGGIIEQRRVSVKRQKAPWVVIPSSAMPDPEWDDDEDEDAPE